jgi:glutaredoxin 3
MSNPVIVYGAPWCGFCHTAMRYFDQLGVKYEYVDIDQLPNGREIVLEKSGQLGIPILDFDGDVIVGFDRPKIDAQIKDKKLA